MVICGMWKPIVLASIAVELNHCWSNGVGEILHFTLFSGYNRCNQLFGYYPLAERISQVPRIHLVEHTFKVFKQIFDSVVAYCCLHKLFKRKPSVNIFKVVFGYRRAFSRKQNPVFIICHGSLRCMEIHSMCAIAFYRYIYVCSLEVDTAEGGGWSLYDNSTGLTHWGRDKMAAIFQTTFSNTFSWMKMH